MLGNIKYEVYYFISRFRIKEYKNSRKMFSNFVTIIIIQKNITKIKIERK